ncbi:YbaY family lipoprotein [Halomonas organivorans]|uniref:Putative lipoprotein n=1 Tax=Halomonas organivorans TaxID=257772 RepID=A0A7W5BU98_9GAMM|nr:YbaY family lipoprotein [Halomonas organivorans]MBB3139240.1 putative lipoprotein [Halomonas organivorans]
MKRHLFIVAALTGTLALAGCDKADDTEQDAQAETTQTEQSAQGEQTAQSEQTDQSDTNQDTQQASKTLDGVLEFAATDTPLPDDAQVVVSLRDEALADAPATIITETNVDASGNGPVEFSLDYPTDQVDPGHAHALHAEVFDGDGNLRWNSPERHPVEVGPEAEQAPITLTLEPVATEAMAGEPLEETGEALDEAGDAVANTAGEAVEATEQAAGDAAEATQETAEDAAEATQQAAEETAEELDEVTQDDTQSTQ